MNNISSQPVEDGGIEQEQQIPSHAKTFCSEYEQRCPATTPPLHWTEAPRVARSASRDPTELKMRSVIIAISVNFATSPAKSM